MIDARDSAWEIGGILRGFKFKYIVELFDIDTARKLEKWWYIYILFMSVLLLNIYIHILYHDWINLWNPNVEPFPVGDFDGTNSDLGTGQKWGPWNLRMCSYRKDSGFAK